MTNKNIDYDEIAYYNKLGSIEEGYPSHVDVVAENKKMKKKIKNRKYLIVHALKRNKT